MKPLIYTSPYAWIFWIVFALVYLPEFGLIGRSRPSAGESVDRGSMLVIMIAAWIGYPIVFSLAKSEHFHLAHEKFWLFLGLALLVSGSLLRRYCWRVLGRFFTGNVRVQQAQTIVQHGPYRLVRHPSYTGGMLMHVGCRLASKLDGGAGAVYHNRPWIFVSRARRGKGAGRRIGRGVSGVHTEDEAVCAVCDLAGW